MPFVPTGYLTLTAASDRVVELRQGVDGSPLLTEEQRGVLRDWQRWRDQLSRPQPKPVTPVPKAGDRGLFVARTPGEKYPHRLIEAEPRRPDVTPEEIKALLEKEISFKEQQRAAGEVLRQLLYAGRVPLETLNENGSCIETPKHIWGGKQWDEALRSNWVEFPGACGLSVSGRPIILLDALEAAFNPDGTVKEEPQPVVSKSTAPSPVPVTKAGTTAPTADAPHTRPQSETAKLRKRLTKWIEEFAHTDEAKGLVKADFFQLAQNRVNSGISYHMFREAWSNAEIPGAFSEPGVRLKRIPE